MKKHQCDCWEQPLTVKQMLITCPALEEKKQNTLMNFTKHQQRGATVEIKFAAIFGAGKSKLGAGYEKESSILEY